MDKSNEVPSLVLIAGPSCAGKTDLAHALLARLPGSWVLWEADRAQPLMGPLHRPATSDDESRLLEANLRSIRSYLDSGFNVLGELFMWYATGLEIAARVFGGIEPFIIELTCRLDVLESREKQRGTTHVGFARSQVESRKLAIPADVTLDSEIMSTIQLTEAVLAAWAR